MTIYFNAQPLGFYDSVVYGERVMLVPDPLWQRPMKFVPDPGWVASEADSGNQAPMVEVPDLDIQHPLVEVANPDCGVPGTAVSISPELHQQLLAAQRSGKIIQAGEGGMPVAMDPPLPTVDEVAAIARAKRDALLQQTDWLVLRAMESGMPLPGSIRDYRTALRDLTSLAEWPNVSVWPAPPNEVGA